jgi:hypothetical protein
MVDFRFPFVILLGEQMPKPAGEPGVREEKVKWR